MFKTKLLLTVISIYLIVFILVSVNIKFPRNIFNEPNDYNYIENINCEYKTDYCLDFSKNNETSAEKILVIGDSTILALANYLQLINNKSDIVFLGTGSCPMIPGVEFSFSNTNCAKYSADVCEIIKSNRFSSIFLMNNYYAYNEYDSNYLDKLNQYAIDLLQYTETVSVIENVKPINNSFQNCVGRPFKTENCNFSSYIDLKSILDSQIKIIRISKSSLKVREIFRDDVHLNLRAVPLLYSNLLQILIKDEENNYL